MRKLRRLISCVGIKEAALFILMLHTIPGCFRWYSQTGVDSDAHIDTLNISFQKRFVLAALE